MLSQPETRCSQIRCCVSHWEGAPHANIGARQRRSLPRAITTRPLRRPVRHRALHSWPPLHRAEYQRRCHASAPRSSVANCAATVQTSETRPPQCRCHQRLKPPPGGILSQLMAESSKMSGAMLSRPTGLWVPHIACSSAVYGSDALRLDPRGGVPDLGTAEPEGATTRGATPAPPATRGSLLAPPSATLPLGFTANSADRQPAAVCARRAQRVPHAGELAADELHRTDTAYEWLHAVAPPGAMRNARPMAPRRRPVQGAATKG